jgi:hypothetical protein
MERRTYEFTALSILIAAVGMLTLARYHHTLPRFHQYTTIPLTGAVHAARLDRIGENRLNINSATITELDALPGISSNIAADIVLYRTTHPFIEFVELTRIHGIGEKRLSLLADRVYCGDTLSENNE